jgi:xanthine/CO dehydrogenase XdhC/CoxF family maturation factor
VDRVIALAEGGRRSALATVIRIEGSSYRTPGAKLLIENDGRTRPRMPGTRRHKRAIMARIRQTLDRACYTSADVVDGLMYSTCRSSRR